MFRVAIVEDEPEEARQAEECLRRFGQENRIPVQVDVFSDGARLVEGYRHRWDLLLLDVDMPVMNGLDTARSIRQSDPDVCILFLTNLAQYAIHGYEVDALDYLLKPINYYALAMRLKRALRVLRTAEDSALMVRQDGGMVRVPLARIFYIEVFDHSLHYHTADGEIESGGATLSGLEKELGPKGFVRCHNGCLVNLRYVDGVHGSTLTVMGRELPVSRNRRRAVLDALLAFAKGGAV